MIENWKEVLKKIPKSKNIDQAEAVIIAAASLRLKPKIIIEIGVYKGQTSRKLRSFWSNAKLYLVDPFGQFIPKDGSRMYRENTEVDWEQIHKDIRAEFNGPNDLVFRCTSEDFFYCRGEYFKPDIIFIDGDHSYEGVKRDIELSLPYCHNTLLCGHDYSKSHKNGVVKAVDEAFKDNIVKGSRNTWFYWIGD